MQAKTIDLKNKTEINKKFKFLVIGIFIILISVFAASNVFATTTEPNIDSINITFDKEIYSLMDGTSAKIGFTIENNSSVQAQVLVWADCEEDDDDTGLECNYSKQYTLLGNSTSTGAFYVTALDESDSTLTIYTKLLNSDSSEINEFATNIEVIEDAEDGDFSVDVYDYELCIGKTNKITLDLENDYADGLYNLYLSNLRLGISSEYSNPVYIRENKEIDYYLVVPEDTEQGQAFDLQLRIENEQLKVVKEITVFATDCPETNIDFSVTGPAVIAYTLNKEETKSATYTVRNNSNSNKTIYISEEHTNQDIEVDISNLQITLGPSESKQVIFTFRALEEISSGTYDVNLNFFDGVNNISKKVKLLVNPAYNFQVESLTGSNPNLFIGQNLSLTILVKNLGDLSDDFSITTTADNGLRTITPVSTFNVSSHSTVPVVVYLSAGENTEIGNANVNVRISGNDSGFSQTLFYNVNVIRDIAIINLELLSYPTTITIDQNTTKDFEITLRNAGTNNMTLTKIEMVNVPQEVTLVTEQNITLNPGQTKTITARLVIGDIPTEQIDAKLRFVSSNGGVLEKPITLTFTNENANPTKSKLTGYLTLRNSILWGIIFICLLIILLFAVGILKQKRVQ